MHTRLYFLKVWKSLYLSFLSSLFFFFPWNPSSLTQMNTHRGSHSRRHLGGSLFLSRSLDFSENHAKQHPIQTKIDIPADPTQMLQAKKKEI